MRLIDFRHCYFLAAFFAAMRYADRCRYFRDGEPEDGHGRLRRGRRCVEEERHAAGSAMAPHAEYAYFIFLRAAYAIILRYATCRLICLMLPRRATPPMPALIRHFR